MSLFSHLPLILIYILSSNCSILLQRFQITQSNQTFTRTFSNAFKNFPVFACFIESGTIQNSEFSLTYDQSRTILTGTQITINFLTYKPGAFSSSESLKVVLLVTDASSSQLSIGVKIVNVSPTMLITFDNLTLVYNNAPRGMIQIYSLCYPMVYTSGLDYSSTNKLQVNVTQSSLTYINNVYFSYIYYNQNYLGSNVAANFKEFNQTTNNYMIPFKNFAFTPSNDNVLFALRQYSSTSIPFFNFFSMTDFTDPTRMILAYSFSSGSLATFRSDVFFFNNSFAGCPDQQYLFYLILYQTLPYSCIPCHSSCLHCTTNSTIHPFKTDSNSCTTCTYLGYLNASELGKGNCICLPGIIQINGVCQQCLQACLTFTVVYIQTTNVSNFLLTYSYADVVQLIQLDSNMKVYLNNMQISYTAVKQQNSYYIIEVGLDSMRACEGVDQCQIQFILQSPSLVVKSNRVESLCMNNVTLQIENYIDYYSLVPNSLQSAFNILGIAVGMAFAGGSSSLVTILFQLQQLIDAHRYLKLTIPVVFNQLLYNMLYFRFLSILNLFPSSYTEKIQNVVPQDLDNLGPPKLRYYQSGLNLYKNSITGFISVVGILFINLVIYYILKIIPLKATKKLAKKIAIRKFITIHDTLEQLQLPFFYYSLEQLQIVLLHSNLYWIYGMAIMISGIIIGFPFLIVIFIYNNKDNKAKIQIYQDLMQDNKMNQKVTYIYYLFNYYRKIFFAMFLLSIFPGLVQIYLLILLNSLHLAFQVYLVVARTYKSKMKIIIRFINDICIITIQVMILLYNLNNYDKRTMINIGMSCLYLAVVTTIMGVIDVIVKIVDTCMQELSSKSVGKEVELLQKVKINKQFKVQIKCNIGLQLPEMPKDPKQIKFMEDKQLMQNTFDKENGSQSMSVHLHNYNQQSNNGDLDLVYIENDEDDVYPEQPINFRPQLNQNHHLVKKQKETKYEEVDLYQIPKQIDREARKVNRSRKNKKNKYELQQKGRETRNKTNSLVVTETKPKQESSESNDIEDIISQQ